jgi:hypothetical protein
VAFAPIKTDFSRGELSPRLTARVDSEVRARGLALCRNWEPLPTGGLRKRGGTQLIAELISGGSRLVPFKTNSGLDFMLELGDGEMRIYTTSGRTSIETGGEGAANLIVNGAFATSASWVVNDWAEINAGLLRLSVGKEFDTEVKRYFTRKGAASQGFVVSAAGDYLISWAKGGGGAGLSVKLSGATVATLASPGVVTLGAGATTIRFEAYGVDAEFVYVDNASVTAVGAPESYSIVPPWSAVQLPAVQYALETGRDRMIFVHPNVAPWQLTRNANGTWSHGPIAFLGAPVEWTGTNWPAVVEIHGGRLWLAATPAEQNRVWASRVGSQFDFRRFTVVETGAPAYILDSTTQVSPGAAIDFNVATKGAIRWIQAQRNLLIGTDLGEHYLASSSGVVTPTDIQVVLGSQFGSAPVQAVPVGDQVLYVSPDGRRPRVIGFEFQADGWVSHDLAFLSDHITLDLIKEAHWVKAPYPAALFATAGGTVRVCSHDRAQELIGWWRLDLPGGELPNGATAPAGFVNSAAVTDGAYGSIAWLSVTRDTGTWLETFRLDDEAVHLMDARVTRTVGPGGVVSGLEHLEGHLVQLVVNDAVLEREVEAGGLVLTEDEAVEDDTAWVGIKFTAEARTLPLEGGSPRGSSLGAKRRFVKVGLLLHASALPRVNGKRPPEKLPSGQFDARDAAVTGRVEMANLGWSEDAVLVLEQDAPYRTEILGIVGVAQVNDL